MGKLLRSDVEFYNQYGRSIERLDEPLGYFVDREITTVMERAFEQRRPPLNGFQLFPRADMDENTTRWEQQLKSSIGDAEIVEDFGNITAQVDAAYKDVQRSVIHIANKYNFTFEDIQKAAESGKPLQADKAQSAREGAENTHNRLWFQGAPDHGIYGASNAPGTPRYVFSDSITYSTSTAKCLQQLKEFFNLIDKLTNGASDTTQAALPSTAYNVISFKTLSGTSKTVKQHLIETTDGLTSETDIIKASELDTLGPGNTPMALAFRQSRDVVRATAPMTFRQLPPERTQLETEVVGVATNGGLEVNKPKEFIRGEGI